MMAIRDDLALRDYAISLGWTPKYSPSDEKHNRKGLTDADCPQDATRFEKDDKTLWMCGESYPKTNLWWRCATKGAPPSTDRMYNALKTALEVESK